MKTHTIHAIAPALVLLLAALPVPATEPAHDEFSRILVTFDDPSDSHSTSRPSPGRSYRYRSRYKVSNAAKRDARVVAAEYHMKPVDDWPIESLNVYCVVYEMAQTDSITLLLEKLRRDPRVESAQEMHYFRSMALQDSSYNDAYAGFQHGLESMNVSQAHEFANGKGVKIAVIDSGVDLRHEDLLGSQIKSRDFIPKGRRSSSTAHGTAVVSLIVANPNNDKGIVGIAPAAELMALRACWSNGDSERALCNSFTLARAMDFLIHSPPDLINLSIAGPRDPLLGRLIDKALANGTVIVAARPDLGGSADLDKAYPAGYDGVLAVTAARAASAEMSGGNAWTDTIVAPGEQIMVALPDDGYDFRSGSSLAAANASGVIALLLERMPDLDGATIARILKKSQIGNGQGNDKSKGSEVINACRALAEIDAASACQ